MSLFPEHYSSLDDFSSKGGHIRRAILLHVYKKHEEQKKQLDADRTALNNCSPLEDPVKWQVLLEKAATTGTNLGKITNELKNLEYIHVAIRHNTLPY